MRFEFSDLPDKLPPGAKEAFVYDKKKARDHKKVYRKLRRLYLGRDEPETVMEGNALAQMHEMNRLGILWLNEHPQAKPQIAFIDKPEMIYIGGIDDGVKRGFVQTNQDGLALLTALWPWDRHDIPTVTMCRVVIDDIIRRFA